MVRGVLVQVGQAQQQFEHTVALFRVRIGCAFFQLRDNRKGIRKEPLDDLRFDRTAVTESLHDLIIASESVVEEVVEAYLLSGKAGWDEIRARRTPADSWDGGIHEGLRPLKINFKTQKSKAF
jgi:hypothetical protein